MVMLWLSCASLVTAPEQHVKTQVAPKKTQQTGNKLEIKLEGSPVPSVLCLFQLSINGDKEFLDNTHKVNPFHLSPVIAVTVKQSDESQEAGPLPLKVDLSKTCV